MLFAPDEIKFSNMLVGSINGLKEKVVNRFTNNQMTEPSVQQSEAYPVVEKPVYEEFTSEEKLKFISLMPDEGIVVHGCTGDTTEYKLANGLDDKRINYYNYIPKPTPNLYDTEQRLNTTFATIVKTVIDSAKYSIGFTDNQISAQALEISRNDKFTWRKQYSSIDTKGKLPDFLIFKAPKILADHYNTNHRYPNGNLNTLDPGERTTEWATVPAENLLGRVSLTLNEIPDDDNSIQERKMKELIARRVVAKLIQS